MPLSPRKIGHVMRFLFFVLLGCACLLAADDRVKVDNDSVRVLKVVDKPHVKSALHRHEANRVMIYLDPGDITLTYEDGRTDEQHWKAGEVAWSPADGLHTSENVGVAPIRIVEIELKKPAPATPAVRRAELDPVATDPTHNVLLFENGQVRVFRGWHEAGEKEPMHEHTGAGRVAVPLTDFNVSVKLVDGTTTEQHRLAGDAFWSGPVTHEVTNLSPNRFEVVVVEVK